MGFHFNNKVNEFNYIYNGIVIKKYPNGLYAAKFYVNDIDVECYISAWTQHDFIVKFKDFVNQYGGLDVIKNKLN